MSKGINGVRISSSARTKPVPIAGFIVSNKNSVSSVSRIFHYRKPVIVKSKTGWYIKYYYRIPANIRMDYDNKEWYRFRVKEDINRRSGKEREQYAEWLRTSIEESLKNGYNPFIPEMKLIEQEENVDEEKKELGAKDAMLLFLEVWEKRGLEPASMAKYKRTANRLIEWFEKKSIPYRNIQEITQDNIEQFLNELKREKKFSNREYNNTYDFTRTIFNFLLKKKYISESPCAGIDKMKSASKKHRFFDEKNLKAIKKAMTIDPYLDFACDTVYYLCIRSEKELMNLKVGNILWSQNKILAEITKGKSERYIPMDENIKALFIKNKIDQFSSDYYVFGIDGKPSKKPFGKGFFSKRFRKIRDAAGLDPNFTIYGFKHTRVIHLKQDGAPDSDIMSLTGHKDFAAYAKYLRDLGMDADAAKINKLSRKI
jgi:site-specific recombinase XerD